MRQQRQVVRVQLHLTPEAELGEQDMHSLTTYLMKSRLKGFNRYLHAYFSCT